MTFKPCQVSLLSPIANVAPRSIKNREAQKISIHNDRNAGTIVLVSLVPRKVAMDIIFI